MLDLLKSYADKGIELERFTGFLFTACVIGGVAWWLAVSAAVFFSVGATRTDRIAP